MTTIHQLVHTLSYGDAISSEVLALRRCLQSLGHSSEIYAINVHPNYKGEAQSYEKFPQNFNGEIVLHYSLGSPLNALYRSLTSAVRTLIFHNLTPPSWFSGVNPRIVRDIEEGVAELPGLCQLSNRLIADSTYNAQELTQLGFEAQVLELPVDPARWNVAANEGIASLLRNEGGIHLLHVGRLAPNKCVEDIIKIFYFLHHHGDKKSKLWLSGIDTDTELYSFSLKRLARELGVEQAVIFAGCLADSEVRALYENASVYLCMSEHEGFCLPVVEAMRFGLPVIAYNGTALADTVGSGGILVKEKRHAEIAELILEIHNNPSLRANLKQRGQERVQSLSLENFTARVKQLFNASQNTSPQLEQPNQRSAGGSHR